MEIQSLSLANFRNYEKLEFCPPSGLVILVGPNAQGKSAILEAIYLLATSKSHRTSKDSDLIRIGESIARVSADVKREIESDVLLEIILTKSQGKIVKINKVKHSKIGDIAGQLKAVIFSNSDIEMVRGEPARRRRFLNLEISQISPQYVHALGRYKRVLEQRNNLLREIKSSISDRSGLEIWEQQLAAYGATIIAKRAQYVDMLSNVSKNIYSTLTNENEELSISYKPNLNIEDFKGASEEEIIKALLDSYASRRELDLARGTTTTGPHRDDLVLSINNLAAREFASQGQQRTAAIAMKLAEIEIIEQYSNEKPVVLLDDIMAELDEMRRSRIFNLTAQRCQTFVTTTHLTELDQRMIDAGSIYEVKSGRVMPK